MPGKLKGVSLFVEVLHVFVGFRGDDVAPPHVQAYQWAVTSEDRHIVDFGQLLLVLICLVGIRYARAALLGV